MFAELDKAGDGEISYHEFKQWWFLKKNGKPYMDKCPSPFLDALCAVIRTQVRKTTAMLHHDDPIMLSQRRRPNQSLSLSLSVWWACLSRRFRSTRR